MGIKILRERRYVELYEYHLDYRWIDDPGAGFSFPCNEKGELLLDEMQGPGMENYERCEFGEYKDKVRFLGIVRYNLSHWEPRVGQCGCGREIILDSFTNTCDCGRDYNWNGQELAPRSQWGWDTGESVADILRIK